MSQKIPVTAKISCRISGEQKKILLEVAGKNGLELSELIRLRLNDLPIANQKLKVEFFTVITALTDEMNKIGVNINQITAGYNRSLLMMDRGSSACGSIGEFNRLFKIYQEKIDRLYFQLNALLKNE